MNGAGILRLAVVVVLALGASAQAQQIVGGHALDNNLMVGSGGINTGGRGSYANAGIGRPNYSASARNSAYTSNQGVARDVYWTGTGTPQGASATAYQSVNSGGVTVVGGTGAYYNVLSKPLYSTIQTPYQIERGVGGSYGRYGGAGTGGSASQYQAANAVPALSAPTYRAYSGR